MIKNIEKNDVFWDLDLARIWGGFWEGFGGLKTSIFALLGKFLGRLGRREGKGKNKRKKDREEREGTLNYRFLLFGATCIRGDLGASWTPLESLLGPALEYPPKPSSVDLATFKGK